MSGDMARVVVVDEYHGKYEVNEFYRPIAEKLCQKFKELSKVPVKNIIFIDNTEGTGKTLDKVKFAQTGKVPTKWAEVLYQLTGKHYALFIEFFKRNIEEMSREQIVALVYHELRHITPGGDLRHHDLDDFSEMVEGLGRTWNTTKAIIPDLLDDDIDWDKLITGQGLLDFSGGLKVVR